MSAFSIQVHLANGETLSKVSASPNQTIWELKLQLELVAETPAICQRLLLSGEDFELDNSKTLEAAGASKPGVLLQLLRLPAEAPEFMKLALEGSLTPTAVTYCRRGGVALMQPDQEHRTALHWAAFNGQADVCRELLIEASGQALTARGKWIWPQDIREIVSSREGSTLFGAPVVKCEKCRDLADQVYCLQHEISERAKFFSCVSGSRKRPCATALHQAALSGHAEVCRVFLEHGAFQQSSAYGALVIAIRLHHEDTRRVLSKWLVQRLQDSQAVANESQNADESLDVSEATVVSNTAGVVQEADNTKGDEVDGYPHLRYEWTRGGQLITTRLKGQSLPPNAPHESETQVWSDRVSLLFHWAARHGAGDVCELILSSSVTDAASLQYGAALACAADGGHGYVCELLLRSSATRAAALQCGAALVCAVDGGHLECCRTLFADVEFVDFNGWRSGSLSLWRRALGHESICMALLEDPVFAGQASSMHIVAALTGNFAACDATPRLADAA